MRKAIERLEKKYGKSYKDFYNHSIYGDTFIKKRGFFDVCHIEFDCNRVLFYFLVSHDGKVYIFNR